MDTRINHQPSNGCYVTFDNGPRDYRHFYIAGSGAVHLDGAQVLDGHLLRDIVKVLRSSGTVMDVGTANAVLAWAQQRGVRV